MITVEELIIQSLFYRLTVIRVKKQPTDGSEASTSTSTTEEHHVKAQERQDESLVLSRGDFVLHGAPLSDSSLALGTQKIVPGTILSIQPPNQHGEVSLNKHSVIQTSSGLQLTQRIITCAESETQTEDGTGWEFKLSPFLRPSMSHGAMPVLDLSGLDNFSVLQLEDVRDPKRKNFVLVDSKDFVYEDGKPRINDNLAQQLLGALQGASGDSSSSNERASDAPSTPKPRRHVHFADELESYVATQQLANDNARKAVTYEVPSVLKAAQADHREKSLQTNYAVRRPTTSRFVEAEYCVPELHFGGATAVARTSLHSDEDLNNNGLVTAMPVQTSSRRLAMVTQLPSLTAATQDNGMDDDFTRTPALGELANKQQDDNKLTTKPSLPKSALKTHSTSLLEASNAGSFFSTVSSDSVESADQKPLVDGSDCSGIDRVLSPDESRNAYVRSNNNENATHPSDVELIASGKASTNVNDTSEDRVVNNYDSQNSPCESNQQEHQASNAIPNSVAGHVTALVDSSIDVFSDHSNSNGSLQNAKKENISKMHVHQQEAAMKSDGVECSLLLLGTESGKSRSDSDTCGAVTQASCSVASPALHLPDLSLGSIKTSGNGMTNSQVGSTLHSQSESFVPDPSVSGTFVQVSSVSEFYAHTVGVSGSPVQDASVSGSSILAPPVSESFVHVLSVSESSVPNLGQSESSSQGQSACDLSALAEHGQPVSIHDLSSSSALEQFAHHASGFSRNDRLEFPVHSQQELAAPDQPSPLDRMSGFSAHDQTGSTAAISEQGSFAHDRSSLSGYGSITPHDQPSSKVSIDGFPVSGLSAHDQHALESSEHTHADLPAHDKRSSFVDIHIGSSTPDPSVTSSPAPQYLLACSADDQSIDDLHNQLGEEARSAVGKLDLVPSQEVTLMGSMSTHGVEEALTHHGTVSQPRTADGCDSRSTPSDDHKQLSMAVEGEGHKMLHVYKEKENEDLLPNVNSTAADAAHPEQFIDGHLPLFEASEQAALSPQHSVEFTNLLSADRTSAQLMSAEVDNKSHEASQQFSDVPGTQLATSVELSNAQLSDNSGSSSMQSQLPAGKQSSLSQSNKEPGLQSQWPNSLEDAVGSPSQLPVEKLGLKSQSLVDRPALKSLVVKNDFLSQSPSSHLEEPGSHKSQSSVNKPGSQSQSSVDKPGLQPQSSVDEPGLQPQSSVNKPGSQSQSSVNKPGLQPQSSVNKPGSQSQSSVNKPGSQSQSSFHKPVSPLLVDKPDSQSQLVVNKPDSPSQSSTGEPGSYFVQPLSSMEKQGSQSPSAVDKSNLPAVTQSQQKLMNQPELQSLVDNSCTQFTNEPASQVASNTNDAEYEKSHASPSKSNASLVLDKPCLKRAQSPVSVVENASQQSQDSPYTQLQSTPAPKDKSKSQSSRPLVAAEAGARVFPSSGLADMSNTQVKASPGYIQSTPTATRSIPLTRTVQHQPAAENSQAESAFFDIQQLAMDMERLARSSRTDAFVAHGNSEGSSTAGGKADMSSAGLSSLGVLNNQHTSLNLDLTSQPNSPPVYLASTDHSSDNNVDGNSRPRNHDQHPHQQHHDLHHLHHESGTGSSAVRHRAQLTSLPTLLPVASGFTPSYPRSSPQSSHKTPSQTEAQLLAVPQSRVGLYGALEDDRESEHSDDMSMSSNDPFVFEFSDDAISVDMDSLLPGQNDYERFEDWMSQLPESLHNVPLSRLAIPGSHISFAIERDMSIDLPVSRNTSDVADLLLRLPALPVFDNFRAVMKRIWKLWMPKQALNVHQQLEAGARYLDVRISKFNHTLYGDHGLYTKQLGYYLRDISRFLDAHPKEVIVLHFQNLTHLPRSDKRRLLTTLFQFFTAKMARAADINSLTLQQMWQRRKQIVAVFSRRDVADFERHIFGSLAWSDDVFFVPQPTGSEVQSAEELIEWLQSARCQHRRGPAERRLAVTKAVLSPDMSMLFGEFRHRTMRDLVTTEVCPALGQWLASQPQFNILLVDFVGLGNIAGQVIRSNTAAVVS